MAMKLILKNIGMLKEAEVSLNPLCVIAGVNDNGKSTIGKIVFCIIKAINRFKEDLNVSKEHEVRELFNVLYFALREVVIQGSMLESWHKVRYFFEKDITVEDARRVFEGLSLVLQEDNTLDQEGIKLLNFFRNDLNQLLEQPEDKIGMLERAFTRVFATEFDSRVLLSGASLGSIELWESSLQLMSLQVDRENKVKLLGEVEPIVLRDATFIETPLVLNYHDLLISSQTQLEERDERTLGLPFTTLHTKDLFDKLRVPVLLTDSQNTKLVKSINNIVEGELHYDKSVSNFVFKRNNDNISIKNTASGIKVFGLLQILLANGFIRKNTLLVFDEPENHLHPKWQLRLAEILVELVSSGVYIIVSSHSPYMIEALERYSELKGLKDKSSFYLADNKEIENKSQLPAIFDLLSEPFDEFRKLDAKALRNE